MAAQPGRVCFVAGALGPTSKTASLSPDVHNPAFRAITFDQLVEAYREQARGLLEGGVDLLLVETVFDSLNSKAALFAIDKYFEETGRRVPVMVSFTITDLSGRTLSGPDGRGVLELDLARTAAERRHQLRAGPEGDAAVHRGTGGHCGHLRQRLSERRVCPTRCCRPAFPRRRRRSRRSSRNGRENGWLNIVGGCCGTTPAHIQAHRRGGARPAAARAARSASRALRLSGLEALTIRPETNFVNIGERTNVTGSPKFAKLILAGDYEAALAIARQQVENGAQIIDVNMDEGDARFGEGDDALPEPGRRGAGHRAGAGHDRQLEVGGHRGRAEVPAGQGHRELDQPQGRRGEVSCARRS